MNRRWLILFFAAACGYISLSQEMLWFRAIGYATGGRPVVFAHTLGFFLLGVALGALWGEKRCAHDLDPSKPDSAGRAASFVSNMLFLSALFCYLVLPFTAWVMTLSKIGGFVVLYLSVGVLSCFLGAVFPVLCQFGIRKGESVGVGISHIYAANIVGSTLGPLLTGFVLMEVLKTDALMRAVSLATLALAILVALVDWRRTLRFALPLTVISLAIMVGGHSFIYHMLLERLERKTGMAEANAAYKHVYENRHGIIAVVPVGGIDYMFGGGAFEGTLNIDPTDDSNWITRAYMIAALHPAPTRVLNIGVAGGPWTRVMMDYPLIKDVVGIEIDPAYLDMMDNYPHIGSIKSDPRLHMVIDDGRRWLKRNPDEKFDFVLQNTMLHWRSNSTNLLSVEYFQLIKSHMKPDGVFYLNATHSEDIGYTLAHVFKHVVKVMTFYAGSDEPFTATPEEIRRRLLAYRHEGKAVFDPSEPKSENVLEVQSHNDMTDLAPALLARKDLILITDDNMAPEYKDDRIYEPKNSWAEFFRRRSEKQISHEDTKSAKEVMKDTKEGVN